MNDQEFMGLNLDQVEYGAHIVIAFLSKPYLNQQYKVLVHQPIWETVHVHLKPLR